MSQDSISAPHPSPWLSVWLAPRETIARLSAGNPRRHVLLLAAVATIIELAAALLAAGAAIDFALQPIAAVLAIVAVLYGILGLYFGALMFRWSGRLFGGRATQAQLRAVLAWSLLPRILAAIAFIAAVVVLRYSIGSDVARQVGAAALVLAAVALELWGWVIAFLMLAEAQQFGPVRTILSGTLAVFFILITTMLFRTFAFQPFNTPSGSMMPTLRIGDYIFVSKYAYGYTHYSLPFSPRLFAGRILGSEPQRGDVVVFRLPKDDTIDYVKRIVGMPGERIQMIDGVLNIDGTPIKRERIADYVGGEPCGSANPRTRQWHETLPNGVNYDTLDCQDNSFLDNTPVYTVPAGHYFVLGDNLDNSTDSRSLSQVGYVPLENIIGRVGMIYFSVDSEAPDKPTRPDRIGRVVR